MAGHKRTTGAVVKSTPRNSDSVARMEAAIRGLEDVERAEKRRAKAASTDAKKRFSAAVERGENPLGHLTNEDIKEVSARLHDAAFSLLSMRRLAFDALHVSDNAEWF